jgi:hypothetical protein
MRTIAASVAAVVLVAGGATTALAQGAPRIQVQVACIIDYPDILGENNAVSGEPELVIDGEGRRGVLNLLGTPPSERIQLICEDQVAPPARPIRVTGFECQVFRGRRGGEEIFVITRDTRLTIDGDGLVTMRCTFD